MNLVQFIEGTTDIWLEQFCSDAFWEIFLQKKPLSQMVLLGHSQTNKDITFYVTLERS